VPQCVRAGWCRCEVSGPSDTGYCSVCEGHHGSAVYKNRCLDARRHEIWWCQACRERYALLAWAEQHCFPTLDVPPYVIAAGLEMWRTATFVGRPELIRAARHAIGLIEEQQAGAR
jgi:hypothetical protein